MTSRVRDEGVVRRHKAPLREDQVIGALCAVAGVCANEVLGMRAYDDRYVVVVADGRKLAVPTTTIFEYTIQAALDALPVGGEA